MHYVLFTTTTCPKCPAMKSFVAENIKFPGEILDNRSPDFGARVVAADVQAAPTIVVYDGDQELFRASEPEELQAWLEKHKF